MAELVDPRMLVPRVARLLSANRYRFPHETQLHDLIGQVLDQAGYAFEREVPLDGKNRLDFLVAGAVAIEVKCDGSFAEAVRQVDRYAALDLVGGVVLATTERWGAGNVGPLRNKPFAMARLRRQGL